MSDPTYTLPPYSKPQITLSRTPSPVREGPGAPDALVSGVELIVSKLPRNGVTAAHHHLRALLGEYSLQHPTAPLVPVRITPGDERNAVDYVFVSVDPQITHEARPDLLHQVRSTLMSLYGLPAEWKVGKGPDRTRRVHFQMDSFSQAESLLPKLNDLLNEKGCPYQCSFVSKTMNRITYDLLDRSSVDKLFKAPPVIDHQTFYPSVPRYIQPIYGLEVAILGLKDIIGALPAIDHYIRSQYGNVIATSRLALNGDAYCVIFNTWAQTSQFLADPFTAFDSGLGISHSISQVRPALLYVLNSEGLPLTTRPSDASGPSRQLQAQFDLMQQRADLGARAFEQLAGKVDRLSDRLEDTAQRSAASVAGLSATMLSCVSLQAASSRLEGLQSNLRTSQMLLAFAPADRSDVIIQQLRETEAEITAQRHVVSQAQHSLSVLEGTVAPLGLPSPTPTSSTATSLPQPLSTAPRTRSFPESDTELAHNTRRLRARTDAGQPPTRVPSPIQVESVTSTMLHLSPVHSTASPGPLTFSVPSFLSCFLFSGLTFLFNPFLLSRFLLLLSFFLSRALSCVYASSLFIFFFFLLVSPTLTASLPTHGLSLFSVNANGLHDIMKTNAIKQHVSTSRPHVWVINETKSFSPVASRVFVPGYNTFESSAPRSAQSPKWGVIASVRRDLHCQQLSTPAELNGRLIALDIAIPTTSARGFILRLLAIYAPWDPGGSQPNPQQFWHMLAPLCREAPSHAWCIIGDCNLTLDAVESTGPPSRSHPNRFPYLDFLRDCNGLDLWQTQPDRSAHTHYTFSRGPSRSILDRVAHSHCGLASASIDTATPYIGATDHRPISATLLLSLSQLGNASLPDHPSPPDPQRWCYPFKDTRKTLADFAASVDALVANEQFPNIDVSDDASFKTLYESLTQTLLSAASSSFQLPSRPPTSPRLRNQTIRLILRELKRIGRLIFATKTGPLAIDHLCFRYPWAPPYITAFRSLAPLHSPITPPPPSSNSTLDRQSFLQFLSRIRKTLHKLKYHAERLEAASIETRSATSRINRVLLGGSSKPLYPNLLSSSPPLALTDPSEPSHLITAPTAIKDATVAYFSTLYHHSDPPSPPKPWLSSPSVLSIHGRTQATPFAWPQALTLDALRALLRKGNPRPAPGPDRWEKWFIKALSDSSLALVLKLLNYELLNSHFPDVVKPSTISTIFKRGSRFNLFHYRGICCSNFLLSTPFMWLNHSLGPYISKMAILPPGQVATQPGVQGRDLTSLFAQLESWAHRHRVPLCALRRDQQKGFDRLSPLGFYDAVHAYGLPKELIDLDISAQSNVPYFFRTAFGLTDPLLVSGVTKQGGPLSPLKSTLTTSLGHHWLNDLAATLPGALVVSTGQARASLPHIPPDHLRLSITMVEAMDDSCIFATSLDALHSLVLSAERFQAAYGWLTSWPKSLLLLLNHTNPPAVASLPSIDPDDPASNHVVMQQVAVVTDHMEFLRVPTNDPARHFQRVRDIVDSFEFPILYRPLPFTLLRRLIIQRLVSKIRPLLAFQPLFRSDAAALDHTIANKVHAYLHFPFTFNSQLLTLPFNLHGFDFPSISRLNDSAAVIGIIRDLNHHLSLFRDLASISLADWTCALAHCHSPLHANSPSFHHRYHRSSPNLPRSWIIAHAVMQDLNLSIHDTDVSYLMSGQVALQHLARICTHHQPPPSHLFTKLSSAGLLLLCHLGSWTTTSTNLSTSSFSVRPDLSALLRFTPILPQLPSLTSWLSSLNLSSLTYGHPSLAIPPPVRRHQAQQLLLSLSTLSPPSSSSPVPSIIASDASMIPSPADPLSSRSVTFASASPSSSLCGSLANFGRSASILYGELYGILLSVLFATTPAPSSPPPIFSDHLNAVQLINDAIHHTPPPHSWNSLPARSLYRWILSLLTSSSNPPSLFHIRAHTSASDPASIANSHVDRLASSAQHYIISPPPVPLPTFSMDKFTAFLPPFQYLESHLPLLLQSLLAFQTFHNASFVPLRLISPSLYDSHPPPLHPYTRSSSAYSAVIQLYARSGQLPTNLSMANRFHDRVPLCRFGCTALEDTHHIFVHCRQFQDLRNEYSNSLASDIQTILTNTSLPASISSHITNVGSNLFRDDESWPLHSSHFYLGVLPPLLPPSTPRHSLTTESHRTLTRLGNSCHLSAIRLTARIWGAVLRHYISTTSQRKPKRSLEEVLQASNLHLPSHLNHILRS